MTDQTYITIKENGVHEIEIKKSRFICHLARVTTEEAARDFIQATKKEHWKATHNCSAYTLGNRQEIQRTSDDGEPSGTAGVPMLEVLKNKEIINTVAVVTRYFGGIKLGAGGLIRAYSNSVSQAVAAIGLVSGKPQKEVAVTIQYPLHGKLQHFLTEERYFVKDTLFTDQVTMICLIEEKDLHTFSQNVTDTLNGQVSFQYGETSYYETPLME